MESVAWDVILTQRNKKTFRTASRLPASCKTARWPVWERIPTAEDSTRFKW
jgi:hypothetical protein